MSPDPVCPRQAETISPNATIRVLILDMGTNTLQQPTPNVMINHQKSGQTSFKDISRQRLTVPRIPDCHLQQPLRGKLSGRARRDRSPLLQIKTLAVIAPSLRHLRIRRNMSKVMRVEINSKCWGLRTGI